MCWARRRGAWSITRAVWVTPVLTAASTAAIPRVSRPPVFIAVNSMASSGFEASPSVAETVRNPATTRAKVMPETARQPARGSPASRRAPTISDGNGAVFASTSAETQTMNGPTTLMPATIAAMNRTTITIAIAPPPLWPMSAAPTFMKSTKPMISTPQITRRITDSRTTRESRATPSGLSTTPISDTPADPAASTTRARTSTGYAQRGISRSATEKGVIPKSRRVSAGVTATWAPMPITAPSSDWATTSSTATEPTWPLVPPTRRIVARSCSRRARDSRAADPPRPTALGTSRAEAMNAQKERNGMIEDSPVMATGSAALRPKTAAAPPSTVAMIAVAAAKAMIGSTSASAPRRRSSRGAEESRAFIVPLRRARRLRRGARTPGRSGRHASRRCGGRPRRPSRRA